MLRYFSRILRALIVSSLGFGGGIGLLVFIGLLASTGKQGGLLIAVPFGIVCGIGFGVFLAAIMLLSDLSYRLAMAKGRNSAEIWDLEQTREVVLHGTIREARSLSRNALLCVPNVKAVADDETEQYSIKASVGASWRSPGERMHISISPLEGSPDGEWLVKCVSNCLQKNVAFDYGKNFENVESWLKKMNAVVPANKQLPS